MTAAHFEDHPTDPDKVILRKPPRIDQGPDYERGFIDGMQHQMQSSVDRAVNRMAQPEPEPVAWTDGPHLVMRTDWRDRANYKGPWVDIGRAIPDSWVPVLYTTPPQRKPLTDERLEMIWRDGPYDHGTLHDFRLAARATEAAHGIKE